MGPVVVVFVAVVLITAGIFYLGAAYGREAEQRAVVKILAQYSILDAKSQYAVAEILRSLRADYRRAFNEVYDEVRNFEKGLKKAL